MSFFPCQCGFGWKSSWGDSFPVNLQQLVSDNALIIETRDFFPADKNVHLTTDVTTDEFPAIRFWFQFSKRKICCWKVTRIRRKGRKPGFFSVLLKKDKWSPTSRFVSSQKLRIKTSQGNWFCSASSHIKKDHSGVKTKVTATANQTKDMYVRQPMRTQRIDNWTAASAGKGTEVSKSQNILFMASDWDRD